MQPFWDIIALSTVVDDAHALVQIGNRWWNMSENEHPETVTGSILFHDNPWPAGHRITELQWGGAIHPERGLALSFELQSANYYEGEEDKFPFEGDDDVDADFWHAKSAWANYHSCKIGSSLTSSKPGMLVSDGTTPFVFDAAVYEFRADPMPVKADEIFETGAFSIYLLGHDAVADHQIDLRRTDGAGHYELNWAGQIALAYSGHDDFQYRFTAKAEGVRFDAISLWYFNPQIAKEYLDIDIDPDMTPAEYIAPYVHDPENFEFETRNGTLYAVRKYGK